MLLSDLMPVYDFNEIHAVVVQASARRVFRAIKEGTPAEVPLFRALFALRSLPTRLTGKGGMGFVGSRSLLEQTLNRGFVLLAEKTDREIVIGIIGQFWKLFGGSLPVIASTQEFKAFVRAGYAKVAMNFYVDESCGEGSVELSTETRIYAADPVARKKFGAYWRLIQHGSALSRRTLLKAIKKRAEQVLWSPSRP